MLAIILINYASKHMHQMTKSGRVRACVASFLCVIFFTSGWITAYTLKCSKYGLVLYLLNQWMHFDQACIDTFLGRGKALISLLKCPKLGFRALSSEPVDGF